MTFNLAIHNYLIVSKKSSWYCLAGGKVRLTWADVKCKAETSRSSKVVVAVNIFNVGETRIWRITIYHRFCRQILVGLKQIERTALILMRSKEIANLECFFSACTKLTQREIDRQRVLRLFVLFRQHLSRHFHSLTT